MLVKETHLSTVAVHAEMARAEQANEVISDAAAVTIASWFQSPAGCDREITALSHGVEFDPDELHVALSFETDRAPGWEQVARAELAALLDWAESKTRHVAVTEIELSGDQWAAWVAGLDTSNAETLTPPAEWFVGATIRYRVAEHVGDWGEWVYPGGERYPADIAGYEVESDGSVWVTGLPVLIASEMIKAGWRTDFYSQSAGGDPFNPDPFYWWQAEPWQPGQPFASRSMDQRSGAMTIKIARLGGFTPDEERAVFATAWPEKVAT